MLRESSTFGLLPPESEGSQFADDLLPLVKNRDIKTFLDLLRKAVVFSLFLTQDSDSFKIASNSNYHAVSRDCTRYARNMGSAYKIYCR